MLAEKPSHTWWHRQDELGSAVELARAASWQVDQPGRWQRLDRHFRDGHTECWWGLEAEGGPYGRGKAERLVMATTDPATLPEATTWYLVTHLPAPGVALASSHAPAEITDVVRLYGLRQWIEQSYKQVKQNLGWAQYQVRSDLAIRRHWQLVCGAFSFSWWAKAYFDAPILELPRAATQPEAEAPCQDHQGQSEVREKSHATEGSEGGLCSWPVALRHVRAWLEPGVMLWRYWRGWSDKPPPSALQELLDWLWKGRGIELYIR